MIKQFLTFNINGQTYGFPIEKVREINRIGEVTKVPNTADHYAGVMNLRGSIISVVSLRLKMGLPLQENSLSTCTIVVDCLGQQVATVVDGVHSVINIEENQIEKNSIEQNDIGYIDYIAKVDDQIIMLVNIEKCLMSTPAAPESLPIAS